MRTGPCVFDPAASLQPRGPSASCLFNNPHSLSSYSLIALGRLWIQSKSTPGQFFDIKASVTETVKKGGEKGKKNNNLALCFVDLQAALELFFLFCQMFFKNVMY